MKRILLVFLLLPIIGFAQRVFVTKNKNQADYICYVTDRKNEADWVVKITTWESTSRIRGNWMYVKSPNFCDFIVYYTRNKNEADKYVYFTKWNTDIKF